MKKDADHIKLEDAMARISDIVRELEEGAELEKAVELYREGNGLIKMCNQKIEEAQKAISVEE
ncbi:MAG: exodeoxyribonuclease VII small subunit [Clostridiales bacterium]|nr:MAG: exodeoxyribonuclease VII small subunit [Clostridiales bacterium]